MLPELLAKLRRQFNQIQRKGVKMIPPVGQRLRGEKWQTTHISEHRSPSTTGIIILNDI